MARVAGSGPAKGFEGPDNTGIPDSNSIQMAIRKTLDNESLANPKDMVHLSQYAKLDLFWPQKRTTIPIDAVAFRFFPTVTISVSNFQSSYTANGDLQISFGVSTNNKTGYSISFNFNFQVGGSVSAPSGNNGPGLTQHSFTIPAGSTFVTCSFVRTGVANGTQWSVAYQGSPQDPIYNTISLSGSNYSGTATLPASNRTQYSVKQQFGLFCDNSDWNSGLGSPTFQHFATNIAVGVQVFTSLNGSQFVANGFYNWGSACDNQFNTNGVIYEVVNGTITQTINCTYEPCSF